MKKGKTPLFCNKKAIIPIFFVSILWFLYGGKRWICIRARASVLARIAKRPAPKGGSWRNAPRGVNRAESTIPDIKKKTPHCDVFFWWEEVDSYKSESERACTHSEASSTERWFRIHHNMRKRWIASALGSS